MQSPSAGRALGLKALSVEGEPGHPVAEEVAVHRWWVDDGERSGREWHYMIPAGLVPRRWDRPHPPLAAVDLSPSGVGGLVPSRGRQQEKADIAAECAIGRPDRPQFIIRQSALSRSAVGPTHSPDNRRSEFIVASGVVVEQLREIGEDRVSSTRPAAILDPVEQGDDLAPPYLPDRLGPEGREDMPIEDSPTDANQSSSRPRSFAPERLTTTTRFFQDVVLFPLVLRALFGEKLEEPCAEIKPHSDTQRCFCRDDGDN
jgi:hypothetical protein